MSNRYCNLVGTNKVKDEYSKVNTGFEGVQQDIDEIVAEVEAHKDTDVTVHPASKIFNDSETVSGEKVSHALDNLNTRISTHVNGADEKHSSDKITYDDTDNTKVIGEDVESALDSIENELKNIIAGDANAEVGSAHISTVKDKTFVDIDERFEEIEQDHLNHLADLATNESEGHVIAGENVNVTNGIISISNSSVDNKGVVQLHDGLNSIEVDKAPTANALKQVNDKASSPQDYMPDNSLPSSKLKQATDADKIQMANLSAAVLSAMNGQSPTGTTPADGSVVTAKLADGAVEYQKISTAAKTSISIYGGADRLKTVPRNLVYGGDGTIALATIEAHTGDTYFHSLYKGNTSLSSEQFVIPGGGDAYGSYYFYRLKCTQNTAVGKYMCFAVRVAQGQTGFLMTIRFRTSGNVAVPYNGQEFTNLIDLGDGWYGLQNVLVPTNSDHVEFRLDARPVSVGLNVIVDDLVVMAGKWLQRDDIETRRNAEAANTLSISNAVQTAKVPDLDRLSNTNLFYDPLLLYQDWLNYQAPAAPSVPYEFSMSGGKGYCKVIHSLLNDVTAIGHDMTLDNELFVIGRTITLGITVTEVNNLSSPVCRLVIIAYNDSNVEISRVEGTTFNTIGNKTVSFTIPSNTTKLRFRFDISGGSATLGTRWYKFTNFVIYASENLDVRGLSNTSPYFVRRTVDTASDEVKAIIDNLSEPNINLFPDPLMVTKDWVNYTAGYTNEYAFENINGKGYFNKISVIENTQQAAGVDILLSSTNLLPGDVVKFEFSVDSSTMTRDYPSGTRGTIIGYNGATEISRAYTSAITMTTPTKYSVTYTIPANTTKLRLRFDIQSPVGTPIGELYRVGYAALSKVETLLTKTKQLVGIYEVKNLINAVSSTEKTYYVSPTGSDNNTGTKASPFATLGKALTMGATKILVKRGRYTTGITSSSGNTGKKLTILPYEDSVTTYVSGTRPERPLIEIINGEIYSKSQLVDSGLVNSSGKPIYYITISESVLRALNTYWVGVIDSYNPTNFVDDTSRGVSFKTGVYAFPLAFMDTDITADKFNILRDKAHNELAGYNSSNVIAARQNIFLDLFPQPSIAACQANTQYTYTYSGSPKTATPTASCFYDTATGRLYMNFGTRTDLITAFTNSVISVFLMKSGTGNTIDLQYFDSVEMQDVVVIGSALNSFNFGKSASGKIFGCKSIISNGGNGFSLDYANLNLDWCDAYCSLNDGFNIHGFGTTLYDSCIGAFNKDDGISHHDGCNGTVKNGIWTYNGKGGISSPTYGSIVEIVNNLLAFNGYGVYNDIDSGNSERSFRLTGNMIKGNNIGVMVDTNTTVESWNNVFSNNNTNRSGGGTYRSYNDTDL